MGISAMTRKFLTVWIRPMNKLFGLFLLALAFLAPASAEAATCFWFGGTNNLNNTGSWFAATGGTGGACAAAGGWPNSTSDTATFDASSGTGTITRNVAWTIGTLNFSTATGGIVLGNSGDTATVDVNTLIANGSGTRTLNLGASTWTTASWSVTGATNLTLNANTSTLRSFAATQNNFNSMNMGAFTYNVVTLQASAVGGAVGINTGNVTIGTLNIQAPNYIYIQNGNNITVTGSLVFSGGGPNAWTGFATTAPTNSATFTLSGGPATCNYCSFRDITSATNGITATNSIDYGRATNITITPPSASGSCPGRIIGGENKFQSPIPSRRQLASVC
jgi:hypothetical protein